jgi:hypothetical protein
MSDPIRRIRRAHAKLLLELLQEDGNGRLKSIIYNRTEEVMMAIAVLFPIQFPFLLLFAIAQPLH